jgi:hypothetical protein
MTKDEWAKSKGLSTGEDCDRWRKDANEKWARNELYGMAIIMAIWLFAESIVF